MESASTQQTKVALATAMILATLLVAACSPAKWHETQKEPKAVRTGDPVAERQVAPRPLPAPAPGDRGFVSSNRLCGRRVKDRDCSKDDIVIERNDEVRVKKSGGKKDELIEVEVVKTKRPDVPPVTVYVPPEYINETPVEVTVEENAADRYFVVENIATEKLRVYEKCGASRTECLHRLVLETDMVVGQDAKGRRSNLGSYTLTKWFKFYEDNQGNYPSWFNPRYPHIPKPGAEVQDWAARKVMPNPNSDVRGSFGWYTAYVGPNADEQWTHGTWGWGRDKDKFIDAVRSSPLDQDGRFASHGCSRVENQAIALMREMLVPGTKVIRIYAREGYRFPESARQSSDDGRFPWILTSEGSNKENGPRSGKESVKSRKVSKKQVMEWGVYKYKSFATAVPLTSGRDAHRNGNSYALPQEAFSGMFNVDEGRLTPDYRHPHVAKIKIGGHADELLPSVILTGTRDVVTQDQAAAPAPQPTPKKIGRSAKPSSSAPAPAPTDVDPIAEPLDEPVADPSSGGSESGETAILDPSVIHEAAAVQ